MAGLVETLENLVESELDRLAVEIEAELKSGVSSKLKHKGRSTGAAVGAIHIEKTGAKSRFIGADINWGNHEDGGVHLYYFDQGNKGNAGNRIYPTRAKALHLKHIGEGIFAGSVTPYKGSGVIKEVADRHR